MQQTESLASQELQRDPLDNLREAKQWRVYFNSRAAYPHIWSVDEGTSETEMLVRWCEMRDCPTIFTRHALGPQPAGAEREPQPIAWIELIAVAVFARGGVTFYGRG